MSRAQLLAEEAKDTPGRVVFLGLVLYLIFDRIIPDLYILPVGFSLKVSHVVAGLVILLLLWSMAVEMLRSGGLTAAG